MIHVEEKPATLRLFLVPGAFDQSITNNDWPHQLLHIAQSDGTTLFQGWAQSGPLIHHDDTKVIIAKGYPKDSAHEEKAFLDQLNGLKGTSLACFFDDPTHKKTIHDWVEPTPYVVYYNKNNLRIEPSHHFFSPRCIDISHWIIDVHCIVRTGDVVSDITIHLHAQWMKQYSGFFDVMQLLRPQLDHGMITTLTPESIKATWPRVGPILNHHHKPTGYHITRSFIKVLNDQTKFVQVCIRDVPDHESRDLSHPCSTGKKIKKRRCLQQSSYKAALDISYYHTQKRLEFCTLHIGSRPLPKDKYVSYSSSVTTQTLYWHIFDAQHYITHNDDHLFTTTIGKTMMLNAYHRGVNLVNKQKRCHGICVVMPFEKGCTITLDDQIQIKMGSDCGVFKVTKVAWSVSYEQSLVTIEAYGLSPGEEWIHEGADMTSLHMVANDEKNFKNVDGVSHAHHDGMKNPVESIDMSYLAPQQVEAINHWNKEHDECEELVELLTSINTTLTIRLKDLSSVVSSETHWIAWLDKKNIYKN